MKKKKFIGYIKPIQCKELTCVYGYTVLTVTKSTKWHKKVRVTIEEIK